MGLKRAPVAPGKKWASGTFNVQATTYTMTGLNFKPEKVIFTGYGQTSNGYGEWGTRVLSSTSDLYESNVKGNNILAYKTTETPSNIVVGNYTDSTVYTTVDGFVMSFTNYKGNIDWFAYGE